MSIQLRLELWKLLGEKVGHPLAGTPEYVAKTNEYRLGVARLTPDIPEENYTCGKCGFHPASIGTKLRAAQPRLRPVFKPLDAKQIMQNRERIFGCNHANDSDYDCNIAKGSVKAKPKPKVVVLSSSESESESECDSSSDSDSSFTQSDYEQADIRRRSNVSQHRSHSPQRKKTIPIKKPAHKKKSVTAADSDSESDDNRRPPPKKGKGAINKSAPVVAKKTNKKEVTKKKQGTTRK